MKISDGTTGITRLQFVNEIEVTVKAGYSPYGLYGHCNIVIGDNRFLTTGGYSSGGGAT